MFDWSPQAPDRIVYVSNESGVVQVHAWDRAAGTRRRVTASDVGVYHGVPSRDGENVLWFEDETGDESGRWFVQPFSGGEARPLDGLPRGWNEGLAQGPGVIAAAISDRAGFALHVAGDGEAPREIYRSSESIAIGSAYGGGYPRGGLSADGSLLCLEHTEGGDLIHTALRVIEPGTGRIAGDMLDEGMALSSSAWSPLPDDRRLAIVHEHGGEDRPGLWDLATGELSELQVELSGVVHVCDWWPEGDALLLLNLHRGRHHLLRYDLSTRVLSRIDTPRGTIRHARVRPDGRVWYLLSQGHRPPRILEDSGEVVLEAEGEPAPGGRPYFDWHFENPHGQRVEGFYATPDAAGPFPTIMLVHGGPTAADTDSWDPEVQAYVDAGFAVALVNYRGSTGYGRGWRDTLIGNIGEPELEDVNAGLADLVAERITDPERSVIGGWSWGGYVTLLELGKHPELWICGVAGVPVGDYEESYVDLSPLLQAYDRALLGATPQEVPDLMRDRNPIYFTDAVRAPVLLIAGENDSRCPFRQVMLYADKLKARGHPHEVYSFSTGHGSFAIDERVRQMRAILEFLSRHVPGAAAP